MMPPDENRRALIPTRPAPPHEPDCLVLFVQALTLRALAGAEAQAELRFTLVPDERFVGAEGLDAYLALISGFAWPSAEEAAHAMLEDFNERLQPRYAEIVLDIITESGRRLAVMSRRKPGWDNFAVLTRG